MTNQLIPINRSEDGELLGFICCDTNGWQSRTIFGYVFARTTDRAMAEQAVIQQGLTILKGTWQYLDPDDRQWHACILSEVTPTRVTVIRTNEMGYQEPESYKRVIIKHPDETCLINS